MLADDQPRRAAAAVPLRISAHVGRPRRSAGGASAPARQAAAALAPVAVAGAERDGHDHVWPGRDGCRVGRRRRVEHSALRRPGDDGKSEVALKAFEVAADEFG